MNTYLTTTECETIIQNWVDYSVDEQTYALEQSYLLVNSFIKPSVKIPNIEVWDGSSLTLNAPAILKYSQAEFIRYLLAKMQYLFSEDLQNQYNAVVELLEKLENGHIAIETQTFGINAGCSIISSNTTVSGSLEVLNNYSGLEDYYTITIDNNTTGTRYPYNSFNNTNTPATFKWKTKSSDWQETLKTCYSDNWTQIGFINVRFIGSLSAGDMWVIHCIPESSVNAITNETKLFHQMHINY